MGEDIELPRDTPAAPPAAIPGPGVPGSFQDPLETLEPSRTAAELDEILPGRCASLNVTRGKLCRR